MCIMGKRESGSYSEILEKRKRERFEIMEERERMVSGIDLTSA